jgi:hypothetical protein
MDETEDQQQQAPWGQVSAVSDLAQTLRETVGRLENLANGGQAQAEADARAEAFARRLRTDPTVVYSRSEPFDS